MNRSTIAILVGVIIGGFFITVGETFIHSTFPAKSPVPTDPALWEDYLTNEVPFISKIGIVINWAFSAFVAGIFGTWISKRITMKPMLASVGVLNILALINLLMLPHPAWMWICGLLAFLPSGLLAYFLIRKKVEKNHENP